MNMDNSKTNEPHIFPLDLSQRLDLRSSNNHNNSAELKYHITANLFFRYNFQAIMLSVN